MSSTGKCRGSGRVGMIDGYKKWTVGYDIETKKALMDSVNVLRGVGLKGISAKVIINAMVKSFVQQFSRGKDETSLRRMRPLLRKEYERITGFKYRD